MQNTLSQEHTKNLRVVCGHIDCRKFWRDRHMYVFMAYYKSINHKWCLALFYVLLVCFVYSWVVLLRNNLCENFRRIQL